MLNIVIFMVTFSVLFILGSCWQLTGRWTGGPVCVAIQPLSWIVGVKKELRHKTVCRPILTSSVQWLKRQSPGYKLPTWDSSRERQGFTLETGWGAPRAAAAWPSKEPIVEVRASDRDTPGTRCSWRGITPPWMPWEHLVVPPGGAGSCCWWEGSLERPANPAATVTWSRLSRRKQMHWWISPIKSKPLLALVVFNHLIWSFIFHLNKI